MSSGDFDSANALNNQYLVQGNEAGAIKVTYYHWMLAPTCPVASSAADSIRDKSTVSVSCFLYFRTRMGWRDLRK